MRPRPRRVAAALLPALAAAGLLAGCGGGGTSASTSPGAHLSLAVRLQRGIAVCRTKVLRDPYIPAGDRLAAAADCEGFKTGQLGPLYAILGPACQREVVAKVPAAKRSAVLSACKKFFAAGGGAAG